MSLELAEKLLALRRPRLLIVGDLIGDEDYHGACDRFAAEAPWCPVFRHQRTETRAGGAGAVSVMCHALGAEGALVHADRMGIKRRFFVEGKQVFRFDEEPAPMSDAEEEKRLWEISQEILEADGVLIADYGKGTCTPKVLRAAIERARDRGVPCIVDPHRNTDWSRYGGTLNGPTAIKCNRQEWDSCQNRTYIRDSVRTEGAGGMWMPYPHEIHFPARPSRVVDTCGAGDMVLATLGVCIAGGLDWPDACRIANVAAGLKCERRGAVGVRREEVIADLCRGEKVLPVPLLLACLDAQQGQGRTIAFTNGCFDVLHAGHVHCLSEARKQADVLVVGLNSDASVRALKGESRPVNTYTDRAAVLATLACVDYVTVFDYPTPEALIRAIRPSVLVKGEDYAREEITGGEWVKAHGGRVHLVPLLPGRSTTRILMAMPAPTE